MSYIKSRKHAAPRLASQPARSGVAAAATLMALAGPALAQTSATTGSTLREVQVQASPENKVDTMASPKYTAPLLDTPQTITVIPARVLEQQNNLSLVEALSNVPGITFGAGEGGGGYGDSINLRGYSASNNILLDGVRDSAQYNRSDLYNIESVEVTSGANSVYSGAGNVSGSINLNSKTPKADNFGRISAGVGTDSYGRLTADVNRMLSETTAFRLNAMAHHNDVPGRDVEKYERYGIAPSITFGLNTPTKVTLMYQYQHDDNVPQYGVPYYKNAFNNGIVAGASRSGYYGYSDVDQQKTEQNIFTGIVEHRFSDSMSVRNLTRFGKVTQYAAVDPPQGTWCLASGINVSTGAACAPRNLYTPSGPRGTTRDSDNKIFTNQTDLTSKFSTGTVEHTLVTGFAYTKEDYDLTSGNSLRRAGGATPNPALPTMSISDPSGFYGGPINFIPSAKTEGELKNAAIYVFDNIKFNEQWLLNGGVRYEHNGGKSRSTTSIATPVQGGSEVWGPQFENSENLLSYRLGLLYKPAPNGTFYVAYGNSKTPSQATVNGGCTAATCDVDPETARNIELGTKWDVLNNRVSLTAAVFRNELQNYKVASNDPTLPAQQLDGKSRVDGLALGLVGQVMPGWDVFANYTYLKSKVLQGSSNYCQANPGATNCAAANAITGNPLTNTPEHAASLWTTYAITAQWTIGYGISYTGSWYLNNGVAPLYKADGYVVQNAMVAYRPNKSWEFQLNLRNLADEDYYTRVRNNGWAVPGDARSATLTASYLF